MFKALLKVRIIALWQSIFGRSRKNGKKRSKAMKILIAVFALYVIGALLSSIGMLFYQIAVPLFDAGLDWFYFAVSALMSFVLSFIGSVFTTQSLIFESKDNDLLLSMPIPPSKIVASRVMIILILNYMYNLLIMAPSAVVYFILKDVVWMKLLIMVLSSLVFPLFSLSFSCLFGWIVALVTSKMKRKNIVSTIAMFVLFLLYSFIYLKMQNVINLIISTGGEIAQAIKKFAPMIYSYGASIADESFINLLWLSLWCIIPFAIVCALLSKKFFSIVLKTKVEKRTAYKEKSVKMNSVKVALLKKEFSRFFSLPIYIFNCMTGAILQLILAVMLVSKKVALFELLGGGLDIGGYLSGLLCIIICFCSVMDSTTAPSISLEGKSFWLLRSIPVKAGDVFFSKIFMNILIGVPSIVIVAVVSWLTLPMSRAECAAILVLPIAVQVFTSMLGLIANLRLPKFDWINETVAIKQGASVLVAILSGIASLAVPSIMYVTVLGRFLSIGSYMLICTGAFVLANLAMYIYLAKNGRKLFESI